MNFDIGRSGFSATNQIVAGNVIKVKAAIFHFDAVNFMCHLTLELSGDVAVRLDDGLDAGRTANEALGYAGCNGLNQI